MRPSLPSLPADVLQDILVEACDAPPSFPPRAIPAVSATCRALHASVASVQACALARVYGRLMDPSRLSGGLNAQHVEAELRRRVAALRLLVSGALMSPDADVVALTDALGTVLLMAFENADRNVEHLRRVGLPSQLLSFIETRLSMSDGGDDGWPRPSAINSLVITLAAVLVRKGDIEHESDAVWETLHDAIAPFVFAAFRYPVGRITVPHFDAASPTATLTAEYFGWRIPLVIPPVSLAAILLLGIRLDARPPEVPTFISTSREPVHGFPPPLGPTKQDVLEVRARAAERLARAGTFSGSELDAAWWRSVRLSQNLPHPYSAYRVGTLTGAWAGTIMTTCFTEYPEMKAANRPPTSATLKSRDNCFLTLREHYCRNPAKTLSRPAHHEGIQNAWLPSDCLWSRKEGAAEFETGQLKTMYNTFDATTPKGDWVWDPEVDVIVTGETEDRHALAWGAYECIGRIRRSDGHIVLRVVRTKADTGIQEVRIWAGYLFGDRHFIGRMRSVAPGEEPADWEAPFCLTKYPTTTAIEATAD